MRVFLDCLGDSETRMRFLATLPANILSREEAIEISAAFNGISREMIHDEIDSLGQFFHPFQDLYLVGLLAVVAVHPDSERQIQKFRGPDDLVRQPGNDLPFSPSYLLHPALSSYVRSLQQDSGFVHYQHVMVGDQLPWHLWDPVCCHMERHARAVVAPDLKHFVEIVIREARDVLRSHTPRNLPLVLQSIPKWSESKARRFEAGYDELLLWLGELLEFAA